jgi:hypothetical protein
MTRKIGVEVVDSLSRRFPIRSVTRIEWERRASASSMNTRVTSWSFDGLKRFVRRVLMGLSVSVLWSE